MKIALLVVGLHTACGSGASVLIIEIFPIEASPSGAKKGGAKRASFNLRKTNRIPLRDQFSSERITRTGTDLYDGVPLSLSM